MFRISVIQKSRKSSNEANFGKVKIDRTGIDIGSYLGSSVSVKNLAFRRHIRSAAATALFSHGSSHSTSAFTIEQIHSQLCRTLLYLLSTRIHGACSTSNAVNLLEELDCGSQRYKFLDAQRGIQIATDRTENIGVTCNRLGRAQKYLLPLPILVVKNAIISFATSPPRHIGIPFSR